MKTLTKSEFGTLSSEQEVNACRWEIPGTFILQKERSVLLWN